MHHVHKAAAAACNWACQFSDGWHNKAVPANHTSPMFPLLLLFGVIAVAGAIFAGRAAARRRDNTLFIGATSRPATEAELAAYRAND
jgi:hypothetical protein